MAVPLANVHCTFIQVICIENEIDAYRHGDSGYKDEYFCVINGKKWVCELNLDKHN